MDLKEVIQIITSFAGSFGFALLYNLRGRKLFVAGLAGMVSWTIYLIVWGRVPDTFTANLAAAGAATIYAESMARILKTPVTVFLITGIIPLVPGGGLYYTMNYAIAKEWNLFSYYGQQTMLTAASIAAGIIAASSIYGFCSASLHYYRKFHIR